MGARRWTKSEDQKLVRLWKSTPVEKIAKILSRSKASIQMRANRTHGLFNPQPSTRKKATWPNRKDLWSADEDRRLDKALNSRLTWEQILHNLPGRSRHAILGRAKKLRIKVNLHRRRSRMPPLTMGGNDYNWCVANKGGRRGHAYYVVLNNKLLGVRNKLMHRLVYETFFGPVPSGKQVHHINGDTLDNRPQNLELADRGRHQDRDREDRDLLKAFIVSQGLLEDFNVWAASKSANVARSFTLVSRAFCQGYFVVTMPNGETLHYPIKDRRNETGNRNLR